jgi:hypothetical protein
MVQNFKNHISMTEFPRREKFITKGSDYVLGEFPERRPQVYDQISLVPAVYYIRLYIIAG